MVVSYFELKASHFFPPETEQHFISLLLNCGVYQPMWPSEKKKHNLFSLPNHVILAKATAKLKICVPQQIFFSYKIVSKGIGLQMFLLIIIL
jgi:hypothetical protein